MPVLRYSFTTAEWQGRQSSPGAAAALAALELNASTHHKTTRVPRGRNLAERRGRKEAGPDGRKLRVIENVESVGAYLKMPPFLNTDNFSERHIELVPTGAGENISPHRRERAVIGIDDRP